MALAAFVTTSVLAGGNAISIRFSNRELAPLWGAGLRFSLAAALLGVVMVVLKLRPPRGRALTGAVLYGLLNFGAGLALAYYALVQLHAGFVQMLLALVPLVTLLLAVAQRQERLHLAAVAGTLLAVAGVAVLSRAPLRESLPLLSVLATLGSAVCIAQAAVLVRRFPPVHPITMNAVAMAIAAVVLVAGSVLAGEPRVLPQRAATWVALGFAVVVGSIVVFVLYLVVLRYWAASRAAYGFVLTPFITVMLSAWLDDEPIHVGLIFGGLLVLAGRVRGGAPSLASARSASASLATGRGRAEGRGRPQGRPRGVEKVSQLPQQHGHDGALGDCNATARLFAANRGG